MSATPRDEADNLSDLHNNIWLSATSRGWAVCDRHERFTSRVWQSRKAAEKAFALYCSRHSEAF